MLNCFRRFFFGAREWRLLPRLEPCRRFRGPLFFSKTWTCKDVILYSTPKNPTQLQRAQRFSSRRRKNTPYIIVRVRYKPSSTRLSFFFSFCCGVRSKYKNNSTSPRDERAKQAAKVYTHTHTSFSHDRAVLDLTDDASHQRRLLQIAVVVVDVVTSIRDDSFLSFFGNGSYTVERTRGVAIFSFSSSATVSSTIFSTSTSFSRWLATPSFARSPSSTPSSPSSSSNSPPLVFLWVFPSLSFLNFNPNISGESLAKFATILRCPDDVDVDDVVIVIEKKQKKRRRSKAPNRLIDDLWETIDARKEGEARDGFFFDPFSEPIDIRFSLFSIPGNRSTLRTLPPLHLSTVFPR